MNYFMYKKVLEESPSAYFYGKIIKDENGKCKDLYIESANNSFLELFKIDITSIQNKYVSLYSDEESFERYKILMDEAIEKGNYTIDLYLIKSNINCKLNIYSDSEEFCIRIHKTNEKSAKLPSLIRDAPIMAWIKDCDGKYLDVNEYLLKECNIEYKDIIGKTDYDIDCEYMAEIFTKEDKEVMEKNRIFNFGNTKLLEDNEVKYYDVKKWPNYSKDGQLITGTIGIAIENTSNVEAIDELKKNQETFFEIANNIDDIIFIRDDEKYFYLSPQFEKIYGVKPEDINLYNDIRGIANYWDEIIYEYEFPPFEYNGKVEGTMKVKKGNIEKWLYLKSTPLKGDYGDTNKKVGIITDITQMKKMEDEVVNLRMEFFATLSHELRTPINMILSSLQVTDLRLSKLNYEDSQYLSKYLGIIRQNGYRLLKLVNNLIDTTKMDSGNFNHNPKNNDIISYVENICMSVSDFIESNGLTLIFDTNVEERIIAFDQDNIERIILNLLSNAIKFNRENGTIEVTINYGE
ncbi:MAG: PAS domain-containing sensor histidine kinase, partial [Peptostreptococcaceae bacterium]